MAAARIQEVRKADCDAWIDKVRTMAISAIGARPFTYEPEQVQKRKLLDLSRGAIIAGDPGRGKSMGMAYVIDRVLRETAPKYAPRNETPFLFTSSSALWDKFHSGLDIPSPTTTWLFVDDWGTEYREPFAATRADEWWRIREASLNVHTWITTNLSIKQFLAQPGLERVVSRIQSMTDWIEFVGRDQRSQWPTRK